MREANESPQVLWCAKLKGGSVSVVRTIGPSVDPLAYRVCIVVPDVSAQLDDVDAQAWSSALSSASMHVTSLRGLAGSLVAQEQHLREKRSDDDE